MHTSSRRGPRSFDPVVIGHRETDAWSAYYRREWPGVLRGAVGMVAEGFGMGRRDTARGAWYVLRANQLWAPFPDNDPAGAREQMRRFYYLVARQTGLALDAAVAARLEVEWWRLHREHQHGAGDDEPLEAALVELYAYVYSADPDTVRAAARHRVEAMDHSDRWVANGCHRSDPLLAAERRSLVASYAALLDAVGS
jgi:hypothetical protein